MSDNKAYESGYDHGEASRDNDWMFALQDIAGLGDDIPTSPHAFAIWLNEHWPFESRGGPDEPIQGSEEKTRETTEMTDHCGLSWLATVGRVLWWITCWQTLRPPSFLVTH